MYCKLTKRCTWNGKQRIYDPTVPLVIIIMIMWYQSSTYLPAQHRHIHVRKCDTISVETVISIFILKKKKKKNEFWPF